MKDVMAYKRNVLPGEESIKLSPHEMSNIPYAKCQTLPTDKGSGWVYENGMI
jgi:hypothetical protein